MSKGTYPINIQLRNVTEKVDKIIIQEQAKKLAKRGAWHSKEQIIYDIIEEWEEMKKILKTKV